MQTPLRPKKQLPKSLPYEGWSPIKDGVSQSLLQKFVVCRDRFHKSVVLGMRDTTRKEAMEYGSLFHKLAELGAKMNGFTRQKMIVQFQDYINRKYKSPESVLLAKIAIEQYMMYREWAATKPALSYIDAEPVFYQPYTLPAYTYAPNEVISIKIPQGVTIPLRGRIDGVLENYGMWIEENKTKSKVDLDFLQDTIHANIQVMFYAVCSQLKYNRPCKGVIYNIIRKPQLRQGVKETDATFIERIKEDLVDRNNWYFTRLSYEFQEGQVDRWIKEELNPLLSFVYLWWMSIEKNPTNPWVDERGNPNPFHGRRSFGIFDSMTNGKGDLYELIVYGRKSNIQIVNEMFPELQDDDDD